MRYFDHFAAELIRNIEHTRDLIIREAGINDLAFIENHFLKNSETELHRAGAYELPLDDIRIDWRPGIAHVNQFHDMNASGFRINLDFRTSAAEHPEWGDLTRLPRLVVGLFVRWDEGSDADDVSRLHGEPRNHEVAKRHARAGMRDDHAVPALEITLSGLEHGCRYTEQLRAGIFCGAPHRVAHVVGGTGAESGHIVRSHVGIGMHHPNRFGRDTEDFGGDLRHRGIRTLSHIDSVGVQNNAAIGRNIDDRARCRG